MPTFQSNPFRSSSAQVNSLGERIGTAYRRHLANHPFLLFGLPFISVIVGASFLLTPATALRYERHDRKNRSVTHSEAMELGLKGGPGGEGAVNYNPRKRKVTKGANTERDEYYVSTVARVVFVSCALIDASKRLMAKDLDNWEQKRVERWKDEPDGRL